jgi:transposase
VAAGADARRQLKALIITAPEPLRDSLRGRPWRQQLGACTELVTAPTDPVEHRATVQALTLTAQRALAARQDARQLEAELRQLVMGMAPALLAQPGIGPINAAQLLISWSHSGRFRSEAAFAMLAGAAPVQASSGQVVRHRLNRGGDRQLHRALHTIVLLRQTHHGPTRATPAAASPRARASARSAAASSAPLPASCTDSWSAPPPPSLGRRVDRAARQENTGREWRRSGLRAVTLPYR